jgi:hypothetical protein
MANIYVVRWSNWSFVPEETHDGVIAGFFEIRWISEDGSQYFFENSPLQFFSPSTTQQQFEAAYANVISDWAQTNGHTIVWSVNGSF